MKIQNILVTLLAVGVIGTLAYSAFTRDQAVDQNNSQETVYDESVGLAFSYTEGEDGYVLTSHSKDEYAPEAFVKLYTLIQKEDYDFMKTQTEATEGPASLGIAIFTNTEGLSANMWVDGNPSLSNTGLLVGDIERDAVVGGEDAVRYMIDGLYMTQMAVVAHGGYVYVVSGAFIDKDSRIYRDFETLLDSVEFIPTESVDTAQKIDPQVACENALIYMTFESGEAADLFVAECVAGEHLEVIERYISDMGLDGASI